MLLETTMYRHGRQINHSLSQYQNTFALVNNCGFITPVLIVRSFGTSYAKILAYPGLRLSSSTAPLLKRVLTAYRAALKTSDAPLAVLCEKIIEDRNLLDFYQYLALTAPSIMTRP
jgi:hypothetical protein